MVTISIIIPVYNVEPYIQECLESIINQTLTDGLECIMVDDCGQDSSIAIAERIIADYHGNIKFSIINHPFNKGLSGARNTGLKAASGDYVCFVDSDDKLSPDCIEKLTEPLRSAKYDMVIGDYCVDGGDDVFMHLSLPEGEYSRRDVIAALKRNNLWYPMAWGKLYKKQFLLDNGLFFCEGILNEDELFSSELACVIKTMYCLPDANTYIYKVRDNSIMTSSKYERRLESCQKILSEMYRFLEQRGLKNHSVCNDLLYYLFSYANEVTYRYSRQEYYIQYTGFRNIICRHYGERLLADRRIKAFIRDFHFLFPPCVGKHLFRILTFRNQDNP